MKIKKIKKIKSAASLLNYPWLAQIVGVIKLSIVNKVSPPPFSS